MNVAFDPWIPVIAISGKRELVSLCAVFTEGETIVDLAVRPHERVALMRLFICVAHAAMNGPKDYDEWCDVPKSLPDAARNYLMEGKESFELFHETKPWLQVADLSKGTKGKIPLDVKDWTPVSKLNFAFATGNNTTLFDHDGMTDNRNILVVETILSMLTYQCFSPAGLISQVYWNGVQSGKSSRDGPCVPSSMIHTYLRGCDLLSTIHLNIPTYEDIQFSYGGRNIGEPVWKNMPTSLTDSDSIRNATETYVGRLVPMARLIRIHPNGTQMLLGDGLLYPPFTDGFPPEPSATVVIKQNKKKEERAILSYQPAKSFWRELAAVVVKRKAENTGGALSLCNIQDGEECDLMVVALARNKATIIDTAESVFHIPSQLRSPEGTASYESEVKNAESIASKLGWAVETYRHEVDHGWEGKLKSAGSSKWKLKERLHSNATTHYWTAIEKKLPLLMTHIEAIGSNEAIPTQKTWRKMLFASACEAYRITCGQETPRQMKAFAKGWLRLTGKMDESKTQTNESNTKVEA